MSDIDEREQSPSCACSTTGGQRSILKPDAAASADAQVAKGAAESETQQPQQPGRKRPVRVEICEHRNKLIFYRQDKGWKVGYFSEHLHRRSKAAGSLAQQQQQPLLQQPQPQPHLAIDVPANRDGCHRADSPLASNQSSPLSIQCSPLSNQSSPPSSQCSPRANQASPPGSPGSPPSNQLFPPQHQPRTGSPPPRRLLTRLASLEDLEISVRVIHACTSGCFAINS